jgi:hypothetical protein
MPLSRLTIVEVEVKKAPLLGKSRIYTYALAGTLLGLVVGAAIGANSWLPAKLVHASKTIRSGDAAVAVTSSSTAR